MGLIRGLDHQRRLVLPKEILRGAGIQPGEEVEIWAGVTEDGRPCVMLRKFKSGDDCPYCGAPRFD